MCIATVPSASLNLPGVHSTGPSTCRAQVVASPSATPSLIDLVRANYRAHPPYVPSFNESAFGRFGQVDGV